MAPEHGIQTDPNTSETDPWHLPDLAGSDSARAYLAPARSGSPRTLTILIISLTLIGFAIFYDAFLIN